MKLPTCDPKGLSALSVSAVLMACIGHPTSLDTSSANGTWQIVDSFNGNIHIDVLDQGLSNAEHNVVVNGIEAAAAQS
ncbi:hypothetical protein HPT27_03125 [Permianibacter sp. IMCC34836]|uniref:hypothetical protein n=1 Tax=Permianibacter fluminis TaxID=2738515 RepID=UPI0015548DEB|nr:hypothetical protein [Permianibacter fluminis]NQD36000.1 hypothetical protein [Permianibacter fluminis]